MWHLLGGLMAPGWMPWFFNHVKFSWKSESFLNQDTYTASAHAIARADKHLDTQTLSRALSASPLQRKQNFKRTKSKQTNFGWRRQNLHGKKIAHDVVAAFKKMMTNSKNDDD